MSSSNFPGFSILLMGLTVDYNNFIETKNHILALGNTSITSLFLPKLKNPILAWRNFNSPSMQVHDR